MAAKNPPKALFARKLCKMPSFARAKRIIITFHSLGDLDAVGAAIALQRFIGKRAIVAPPDSPNSAARRLIELTKTPTVLFSTLQLGPKDFIVVLDSSSPHLLPHLAGIRPGLIIDHHPKLGGEISGEIEINDPSVSSVCEMLCFLLNPSDKASCLSLALGIISDSAFFRNASSTTFEAMACLLERGGLSYSQLLSLAISPESLGERIEALRSCQSVCAERVGSYIIATALAKSHSAHFAETLLHLGADISFVGSAEEGGHISARMREGLKNEIGLDRIMAEVGKAFGGSGSGHSMAAAASVKKEELKDALALCTKLSEQLLLSMEHGKIKKIQW
ncbi:MAG: DHHA1 domain-containing protein [Candidatus Micrarchaeota archaeon]|nr:DHHA1 domain-containing protein [Candidatus Micrarchaeota archaeon]